MANTKMDIVFDGPLLRGWVYTSGNKCSDPGCPCQSDPSKRHGLYYRWSGTVNGKLITRSISKEAAQECQRRITNYKAVLKGSRKNNLPISSAPLTKLFQLLGFHAFLLLYNLLYYLNYRAYTRDVCRRGNEKAVAFCNKNVGLGPEIT